MDLAPSPRSTGIRHQCNPSCGPSPERSVGFGRLWTAAGVLILALLELRSPDLLRNQALIAAVGFTFYSLLTLLLLRKHRKWPESTRLILHCMDVFAVVLVALLVHASEASLVLLFLFLLAASAQRWGPNQLLWTSGAFAVLFCGGLLLTVSMTPSVNFQEAVRPGAAYVSFAGLIVFATGLLWQLTQMAAAERWESSARAAQRARALISREIHDG